MSRDAIDNREACEQLGADLVTTIVERVVEHGLTPRDAIVTMLSASVAVCRTTGASDEQAAKVMQAFAHNILRTVDAHRKAAN